MPDHSILNPLIQPEPEMDHSDCYIESFAHSLPHRAVAAPRRCGHAACDPHTITYYGTGDDPEAEGDYCMVCYGQLFGLWPDKTLRAAVVGE